VPKYRRLGEGEVILKKDGEEHKCDEDTGYDEKMGYLKCGGDAAFVSRTGEKVLCINHPPPKGT
jgi:hypothetical protein